MKTVKFNEIKNEFVRMAVMLNVPDALSHPFRKVGDRFVPLFSEKDIIDPNKVFDEVSELNPTVVMFKSPTEFANSQSMVHYTKERMFGFAPNEPINGGMVDFVDDEKSVTFYFN